ncbi:MAG TPA: hypothetical protein VIU63_01350 [Nitrospira sp.]
MRSMLLIVLISLTVLFLTALSAQSRDLSKLDACKILTPADVATTTKRKVIQTVGGAVHCGYVVEAPQSGAETYDLFLNEASMVETSLAVKTANEKGSPIPGLWNEAYVGPAIGSKQLSLVALHKGDIAIEIQGPNKDTLIALAMVVVSRLK